MGFLEVLTLIFVICKLTSVVAWTWFQVFIPMYISLTLYLFIIIIAIKNYITIKNM